MQGGCYLEWELLSSLFQSDNFYARSFGFSPWVFFHCWSFCQKQLGLQRALTNRAGTDLTVWQQLSQQGGATHTVPAGVGGMEEGRSHQQPVLLPSQVLG